jgi:hypothetical protein
MKVVAQLARSAGSVLLATVVLLAGAVTSASATVAYDPTGVGPHAAVSSFYKLPAKIDPSVTSATATELWARVWYPRPFATNSSGAIIPSGLVIMLHGEHPTCGRKEGDWYIDDNADYTVSGKCPTAIASRPIISAMTISARGWPPGVMWSCPSTPIAA